jgi:hypothetical protein
VTDQEGYVLEIRRGQGEPRFLRLPRGTDLQPTSIGGRGDFRVDADGVLDVHLFVYFDGETLFVQSAESATPVRVNGRPAGSDWTRVEPPSTLAFGDARVVFCPASQASAVSAAPAPPARPAAGVPKRPPPQQPPPQQMEDLPTMADMRAVPLGNYEDVVTERVKAPDEDATHSIPIPGGRAVPPQEFPDDETTRALPLPAVVAPVVKPAPPAVIIAQEETAKIAVGGPIAAPPPAAPTVKKESPLDQLKSQWKAASLPKKAILVLLPIAFFMVVFGLDDKPVPAPTKAKPTASGSASAHSEKAAKVTKPTATEEVVEEPTPPKPTATAPIASAPPAATNKGAPKTTEKTPERAAVDAVAAGSLVPAAELYDELAKTHPENPAYKEAARILRAKAKK